MVNAVNSPIPDSPPAIKDDSRAHPIAGAWRPMLGALVRRFAQGDYELAEAVEGVAPIAPDTAQQVREAVEDYGATLIELQEATWDTSVAQWQGDFWDVMVDLWTAEEGPSDLVLQGRITESPSGPRFTLHMVYVP